VADIVLILADESNDACERVLRGDVKYLYSAKIHPITIGVVDAAKAIASNS
jgi:hypothetical protein